MKKFLPASTLLSTSKSSGFSLIELLIVISIIAVLAVMGFATYRGFTGKGNDARRNADIKAIADALENNRGTTYAVLADNQFANGKIPVDPDSATNYCVSSSTAVSPTIGNKPSAWAGSCPAAALGVGVDGVVFSTVSTSALAAATTAWMVCATMEDNTTVNCRINAQ